MITVAELQRRGLNDEESFWLARRRTGQPNEISEEFAKADPAKIYRERVLWIAVAFYAWVALARFYQSAAVGYLSANYAGGKRNISIYPRIV